MHSVCRRRIGRWLTDATPLLPLITSQQCHFHLQTAPWALTWTPSLTLRFTNLTSLATSLTHPATPLALLPTSANLQHQLVTGTVAEVPKQQQQQEAQHEVSVDESAYTQQQLQLQQQQQHLAMNQNKRPTSVNRVNVQQTDAQQDSKQLHNREAAEEEEEEEEEEGDGSHGEGAEEGRRLVPSSALSLFDGGDFDAGYNKKYKPIQFEVPCGTQKVLLEAVITGHGYDNNQCAEFCPTSHHFTVNGAEHMLNFTSAATPWGCADKVLEGSEPNEHGTWQYGRGGWCDGQEVQPWVVDVSTVVKQCPELNEVTYHGYYQGQNPQPTGQPGFIMMESNLVFYIPSRQIPVQAVSTV